MAAAAGVVAVGLCAFTMLRQPDWAVAVDAHSGGSVRRPGLVLSSGRVGSALLGLVVAGKFSRWTLLVAFLAMIPGNFASGSHGWFSDAAVHEGPLLGELAANAAFGVLATYFLALACSERREPDTITGEVLRMESRKGKDVARSRPPTREHGPDHRLGAARGLAGHRARCPGAADGLAGHPHHPLRGVGEGRDAGR
ncbi:hypothetical protein [Streptomyces sp. NBC_00316]|uniref:hypothetical protein n=1 Tax=Streptomyces sp. NBC_00316 TaxID=2975710 RepID=UPI002E2E6161|nr:hypothetical protein [Streptomyces sp. NBC_00316]